MITTVRGWQRQAHPAMGWRYQRWSVGHYRWHDSNRERSWAWLTLEDPPLDDDALLLAIDGECGEWPTPRIRIDDAETNAVLGPRLLARGWSVDRGNVTLRWVGGTPPRATVDGVEVDEAPDLGEWSVTKLRGFSDADAEPGGDVLSGEVGLRRAEAGGSARLQLARVAGEAVAVIGWYEDGQDVDVFNLATRRGWRGRGIARQLQTSCVARSLEAGVRAVVIGTDAEDTPQQWYRRLGFSDDLFVAWTYTPPQ